MSADLQIEAPAPGTVKRHEQHIFLWSPQPAGRAATGEPDWPAKVERCVAACIWDAVRKIRHNLQEQCLHLRSFGSYVVKVMQSWKKDA